MVVQKATAMIVLIHMDLMVILTLAAAVVVLLALHQEEALV